MKHASLCLRLWHCSFIVTLPLAVLTLLWLLPSLQAIRSFRVIHTAPYADIVLDAPKILRAHLAFLNEQWRSGSTAISESLPLPVYALEIPTERLARLQTRLPSSSGDSVKARIRFPDGETHSVRARFRGDNLNHWGFPVRSWRVRMRDGYVKGQRSFDFVLPRWRAGLSYYLPLRMADEMGLLVPRPSFVFLAVNGRLRGGVHMIQEVVDESFLRQRGRMPGDVFIGDMVLADGRVREERSGTTMWAIPGAWSKTAESNYFAPGSTLPLSELFTRIGTATDAEGNARLKDMLHVAQWARLAAWLQLAGASHFDLNHNWVLLFDAARQRFEPIVRDGNALTDDLRDITSGVPRRDLGLSVPILAVLHRDQEFLRLKAEAIAGFFRQGKDRLLLAEAEKVGEHLHAAFEVSRQLDWIGAEEKDASFHFVSADDFSERLDGYQRILRQWFDLQRSETALKPGDISASLVDDSRLRLRVTGGGLISSVRIPVAGNEIAAGACLAVRLAREFETCTAIDRWVGIKPGIAELHLPLLAQYRVHMSDRGHAFADADILPATYDIVLRGARILEGNDIEIAGADGSRHAVRPSDDVAAVDMLSGTHGIVPIQYPPVSWSGEVRLLESIEIRGNLIVGPETTILLGPEVNVLVRGRVQVKGEPGRPVKVRRLDAAKPWGTFTVIGQAASGSSFRHCAFEGGSGFKSSFTLVSGMFSVHDVGGLEVSDCEFRNNANHDDLIHLVYVDGRMTNVLVENAIADAIDVDIGNVSIDNLTVRNAGNDALDLMTSKVVIRNSSLSRAGDKGISVGENSEVRIEQTTIADNKTGIEVKDGSRAYANGVTFSRNETHISGYHKNLRYVGTPSIAIENSTMGKSSGEPFRLEDGAQAILVATPFMREQATRGVIVEPKQKNAAWDKLVAARGLLVHPQGTP